MTDPRFRRIRHLLASSLSLFLLALTVPATAQSVESVVSDMEDTYRSQMESVDTYILEAESYTGYYRKVATDDDFTVESVTQMNAENNTPMGPPSGPSTSLLDVINDLRAHATYAGTETVDGTRCHVMDIDDPSALDSGMGSGQLQQIRYFVNADTHQPRRMIMTAAEGVENNPTRITIDMLDYRTVDGLSIPHRMEFMPELPEEQKQQMRQMLDRIDQLAPERREQAMQMMGGGMEQMKNLLNGDPIVVEVNAVRVNADIPDGIFDGS